MSTAQSSPQSNHQTMKAVRFVTPEGAERATKDNPADIHLNDEPMPEIAPDEVLIKIQAAGINAADVHQRAGSYPPPPGVTDIPGLEVAGTIERVGSEAGNWDFGTPVVALLAGGGYAEYVAVKAGHVLPVPGNQSMTQAAGLIEVAATVWSNLVMHAGMKQGATLLIHGGTGGIGEFAIKLALELGVTPLATAGSDDKVALVNSWGATGINYRTENFVERVDELTQGAGANVILDVVGGAYVEDNVKALAQSGCLAIIGTQGGAKGTLNVMRLMMKRAWVTGTTLRSRPADEKAAIIAQVGEHVWPMLAEGKIDLNDPEVFPLSETEAAYERFAQSDRTGKLVLRVDE